MNFNKGCKIAIITLLIIFSLNILFPAINAQPHGIEYIDLKRPTIGALKESYEVFGINFIIKFSSFKLPYQEDDEFFILNNEELPINFTLSIIKAPSNASLHVGSVWMEISGVGGVYYPINKTLTHNYSTINLNFSLPINLNLSLGEFTCRIFYVGIEGEAVYGKNIKKFYRSTFYPLISGRLYIKASELPFDMNIENAYLAENGSLLIQLNLMNHLQSDIVNVAIHCFGCKGESSFLTKKAEFDIIRANEEKNITIQLKESELYYRDLLSNKLYPYHYFWLKAEYLTPKGEAKNWLGFLLDREKIAKKVGTITTIMNISEIDIYKVIRIVETLITPNTISAIIVFIVGIFLSFKFPTHFLGIFLIGFSFYMLGFLYPSYFMFLMSFVALVFSLRKLKHEKIRKIPKPPIELYKTTKLPFSQPQIPKEKLVIKKPPPLTPSQTQIPRGPIKKIEEEEKPRYDIIIDGMNVAMAGVIDEKRERGKIGRLIKVILAMEKIGLRTCVVCDASMPRKTDWNIFLYALKRLKGKEAVEKLKRFIKIVPAKTDADSLIIKLAKEHKALILSNDKFEEYEKEYPELPKHLVKFSFIEDKLYLYSTHSKIAESPNEAINSLQKQLKALRGNK
ncbi:MAG: hypothetical protein QW272_05245 [Candidatus Methanomethylicaceae archaeon]